MSMVRCPSCGSENPEAFRLCSYCGTQLSAERPPEEVRRVVTIVQSDLKGSTALGEKLDPESLREVLTRYFDEMRVVFDRHGGTIEKIIGDAIVAVFGLPIPREDDALRAVEAAWESVRVLGELNERLEAEWGVRLVNRTGVATGDVTVGEAGPGQHVLTGDVVRYAVAMEQNCEPLGVLVADSTYRLVEDALEAQPAVELTPKGMDETVVAHQLTAIREPESRGPATTAMRAAALAAAPTTDGRICPSCGAENPDDGRICGMCGASLAAATKARETRRTVTLVFADPKPTALDGSQPDPGALKDVMTTYFDEMRRVLERHGATVEKFIGDAVMAVFGIPVRHEDDALRAVRAALDMQRTVEGLNPSFVSSYGIEFLNHIGVNTGEVVAGDASVGQRLVSGDAVNVAARLEQAAHEREVLIGPLTYTLVKDHVEVEAIEPLTLKGKSQPFPAYRLNAIRSGEQEDGSAEAPMVGRLEEMAALRSALAEAGAAHAPRVATVVGDAGVGKSRLVREFLGELPAESLMIKGRCLPYGDGITFWPLIEMVRKAAGIHEDDPHDVAVGRIAAVVGDDTGDITDRVASVIGLSSSTYQIAELFWAIRRFLEVLAREHTLVVVFDDIHWAEETLLELIRHVATTAPAPILLLCTARTELLDSQPEWSEGDGQVRLVLSPLSEAEAGTVVQNLLGGSALPASVARRIVEAAEGNPLFVEQVLSMLVDNGSLELKDGVWTPVGDISRLAIPPTVHALVAARLDALPPEERAIVDPASVIGLSFAEAAVEALIDDFDLSTVPGLLESIARRQMIRAAATAVASATPDSYRFQHLVIRDAAYQGLLKRTRALLHERFVEWADRVNAEQDRALEFEEILGYHLEQAYLYRTQLGPLDAHGVTVGIRAAERLGHAGDRAYARGDLPAAENLLGRASAVLPKDHERLPRLLLTLGQVRMQMGTFDAAETAFRAALDAGTLRQSRGLELAAELEILGLRHLRTEVTDEQVGQQVRAMMVELEALDDAEGLTRAWRLLGLLDLNAMQWGGAENAMLRSMEQAQRTGDEVLQMRQLPNLAQFAVYSPTPVEEGIKRCEEVVERVRSDRRSYAVSLRSLARLHGMRGDFALAEGEFAEARAILTELGWQFDAAMTSLFSGPNEMLAGDPADAESELRQDYETYDAMGERLFIATTAAYLGEAIYRQDRLEEADKFIAFSREVAAEDDVMTHVLWRGTRSKLLARQGVRNEAIDMAREAVRLAGGSDDPTIRADILISLSEVLAMTGDLVNAAAATREALELYAAKGNVIAADDARRRLRALTGEEASPVLQGVGAGFAGNGRTALGTADVHA